MSSICYASPGYNVKDFGAFADGTTVETATLQAAIDACAAGGGGTVFFPAGSYLTGTLFLKSHVRLELDAGATILGSVNLEDYPLTYCEYPSRTDRYTARALIWGENLEDVAITGRGTLDGQGAHFNDNVAPAEEIAVVAARYKDEGRYVPQANYLDRPYLIRLISCRDVLIEGVTMRNSAMWMQHYLNCDFVTVRGIKVYNHVCANNDMIDIDSCRNVVISDCFGDTDDDALTLKSTGDRATEFVTITNCVLRSHCNAIKAGTESSGGFKDIAISNCVIQPSQADTERSGRVDGLAAIALEIVDGGTLERVAISNITVEETNAPIFIRLGDRGRPPKENMAKPPVGTLRDVSISNIVATGASATGCVITGLPGHPIENLSITNVSIAFDGGGTLEQAVAVIPENEDKYPESSMFGPLPAYGFFVRHVNGLRMRDIRLAYASPEQRPALMFDDVRNLRLDNLDAQTAPDARAAIVAKDVADVLFTGSVAASTQTFLRLEGACERVRVMGNDLTRASEPFDTADTAAAAIDAQFNTGGE